MKKESAMEFLKLLHELEKSFHGLFDLEKKELVIMLRKKFIKAWKET